MSTSLTPKQAEAMLFIQRQIDDTGIAPSLEEIRDALDMSSKGGVHALMRELEFRGYIKRVPSRRRNIEILQRVPVPGRDATKAYKRTLRDIETSTTATARVLRTKAAKVLKEYP